MCTYGMKLEPLFAPSVGGTCRLCKPRAPRTVWCGAAPSEESSQAWGRQTPSAELQDLADESIKSALSHLHFTGINGTAIWQVTSLQCISSFAYRAHPNTL